jgi:hypothetical protein
MGDKSPKSTRKQAHQKQTKTDTEKQKKDAAEAAKATPALKGDPRK